MRYSPSELERLSMVFDAPMKQLEEEIMADIVRRIRINSEITRSADWQIHRLYEQEYRSLREYHLRKSEVFTVRYLKRAMLRTRKYTV